MRVLIVGGGTMGLASAWALSRRGHEVVVFERFGHVHAWGSHGGHTRIFRYSYFESPDYVRLAEAADRGWNMLEGERRGCLLVRSGLLCMGADDDADLLGIRRALDDHRLPYDDLDAATFASRWGFDLGTRARGLFSHRDGYLRVPSCLDALRDAAIERGAGVRWQRRAREIAGDARGVRVLLDDGSVVSADRVVVTAGAWNPSLLPSLWRARGLLARVQRRALFWTRPHQHLAASLAHLPAWAAFLPAGFFYGFPCDADTIGGCKLACHASRSLSTAEDRDPEALWQQSEDAGDAQADEGVGVQRGLVEEALSGPLSPLAGPIHHTATCLYTTTRSGDFLVDVLPDDPRIVVAGGFSGHGFKFAPAIGEIVADLCEGTDPALRLPQFCLQAHAAW